MILLGGGIWEHVIRSRVASVVFVFSLFVCVCGGGGGGGGHNEGKLSVQWEGVVRSLGEEVSFAPPPR